MTYRIDFEPLGRRVSCAQGDTIFEVARTAGIFLTSLCGGRKTCGRCRIQVISGKVSEPSENERACLSEEEISSGFRLACAAQILGNLRVHIPVASLSTDQRLQNFEQKSKLLFGCESLGMAIDLGTTTIAVCLVNLVTGEVLKLQTMMNPQASYGADVMSRISFAMESNGDILRKSVVETINRIISETVNDPEEIVRVTVGGNTAMHHLFLGLPVKQLGRAPYEPAVCHSVEIAARDLKLRVSPEATVYFLPNIAGFVGGDHVAMILSTGIDKSDKKVIGIDIGTNTEVTLAEKSTLTSLSCASGPAFEGAGISHGMRATSGAINSVRIDDDGIHLNVIDSEQPIGICGSGIIDTLSELRRRHIIDYRGVLAEHPRVRQAAHGREFVLAPGDITATGRDIVVTQSDIGEIQLAKAAIRSGINILCKDAEIKENEIDKIIVAGAFGYRMNPGSAINIGLFPPLPEDRFKQVGNAAANGAQLTLLSEKERAAAEEIAKRVKYIELTTHPEFTRQFSHALRFP